MTEVEIITKSRLGAFATCQRLHDIQYNRGYRSLTPREAADRGTIFHDGLDAWWTAYKRDEPMLALSDALTAMVESRMTKAPTFDLAQFAKLEVMMAAYDARWAPTMDEWEVLGIEVEFIAVLPRRKLLRIAGKLDKVLRRRSTGRVLFAEHKTSGADLSEGSSYWARLRMDPQVSIYYGGMKSIGYDDIDGCLYDVVAWPEHRPLKATPVELRKYTKGTKSEPPRLYANQRAEDESLDDFRQRVGAAVAAAPETFFARAEVVRLEHELEESARDVEELALQIRAGAQTGVAPRNPAACYQYNRPCEFFSVCGGTSSLDDETMFSRSDDKHPELELSRR